MDNEKTYLFKLYYFRAGLFPTQLCRIIEATSHLDAQKIFDEDQPGGCFALISEIHRIENTNEAANG